MKPERRKHYIFRAKANQLVNEFSVLTNPWLPLRKVEVIEDAISYSGTQWGYSYLVVYPVHHNFLKIGRFANNFNFF